MLQPGGNTIPNLALCSSAPTHAVVTGHVTLKAVFMPQSTPACSGPWATCTHRRSWPRPPGGTYQGPVLVASQQPQAIAAPCTACCPSFCLLASKADCAVPSTKRSSLICAMQGQASWLVRAHFPSRAPMYLA